MPSIQLTELKLRVFVDTNILIDAFITPDANIVQFLIDVSIHPEIELITSDYVLWEQNEFIRQQTWIKHLVNNGRSYKDALKYSVESNPTLISEIETYIVNVSSELKRFGIENYNLMDLATFDGRFFELVTQLQLHTRISNQDILILLSAYSTQSNAILSKDGTFNKETLTLKDRLEASQIPQNLKDVFFIQDTNKNPNYHYNKWFVEKIEPMSSGICINYYEKANVVSLELSEDVKVGNYLMLIKFNENNDLQKQIFKISTNCLRDYDSNKEIEKGKKVTVKLSDEIDSLTHRWIHGSKVYKLSPI